MGRSATVKLNDDHAILSELVLPLLDRERHLVNEIGRDINREFEPLCRKIVLKDVMTGVGTVDLITTDENLEQVRKMADMTAAGLEERYGFEIEFRVYTFANAPIEII